MSLFYSCLLIICRPFVLWRVMLFVSGMLRQRKEGGIEGREVFCQCDDRLVEKKSLRKAIKSQAFCELEVILSVVYPTFFF